MRVLLLTSIVALVGCATTQIRTDADENADFSRYRSYELKRGRITGDGDTVALANSPLVKERIEKAIARELSAKGLQPAETGQADLIATYTASARTGIELDVIAPAEPGFEPYDEWYWGPGFDDVWFDEYTEDTLVIDLIDAKTHKLVWRAVARAQDKNLADADFIRGAVDKAIEKYPSPAPAASAKQAD